MSFVKTADIPGRSIVRRGYLFCSAWVSATQSPLAPAAAAAGAWPAAAAAALLLDA